MKRKFHFVLLTLFFFLAINISFSQKDNGNILVKGTDEYKLFMAKQSFFGRDYVNAVNKYKEVLANRPSDASVHFFIGQCYFMMGEYNDALDFLEKAKSMKADVSEDISLILGRTYHMKGMLDKALSELNTYKQSLGDNDKKIEESEVNIFIAQCNVAKQLMAKPLNVKLIDLIDLNSQYDDKGPVLTNDDKQMIFTSRRPTGNKSRVDTESDYGYFDDVYESFWNEEKHTWSAADLVKGLINTPDHDACTGISADGTMLFIYRNGPEEPGGGELFISHKATSGKWKMPEVLPKTINSTYYEDGACISPDGNTIYFASERPGGLGKADIYTSQKTADGWAEPVNLGAPVNSSFDENGLYLCPDGKTLFFCSNGSTSMGLYDIFKTIKGSDGKWSVPVNLGYPINSVISETKFVLTKDNKTAYISTVRDSGLGERDIYMVDLSDYNAISGENISAASKTSVIKGVVSATGGAILVADISVMDKSTGAVITTVKSGLDGSYSFELPADKQYVIVANSEGYQKASIDISLLPGKQELKNIILNKNN